MALNGTVWPASYVEGTVSETTGGEGPTTTLVEVVLAVVPLLTRSVAV